MSLILGTKSIDHDQCFALLKDGSPLFVIEAERNNRIKHSNSCDLSSLFQEMAKHNLDLDDVDHIATCIDTNLIPEKISKIYEFYGEDQSTEARITADKINRELPSYSNVFVAHGYPAERIIEVRHHLSHCAAVYYPSPHQEGAILSADGGGEIETTVLAHGLGREINILRTIPWPHSLGHFYQAATSWLGWGYGEEGKTMALAGYGRPRYAEKIKSQFIHVNDDGFFNYKGRDRAPEAFNKLFGTRRSSNEDLTQRHQDIAASVQHVLEEIMLKLAHTLKEITGSKRLFVTGGVGLNSVCNGMLMREKIFEELIAYPQANDTGNAIGSALYVYNKLSKSEVKKYWRMSNAYLGAEIDIESVQLAKDYGLDLEQSGNIHKKAASLLAEGKILGWVQGKAEIGPRALGNRSILANPSIPGIKDKINAQVKHREMWRPFAPSVLAEDCSLFFDADQALPYMIIVAKLRDRWRNRLNSICHIDGTARVQSVSASDCPSFYSLISNFKDLTGLGMLLNTSFNGRGEPLVQTTKQAIEAYIRGGLDALVIGDYLITGKSQNICVPNFHPFYHNIEKFDGTDRLLVFTQEEIAPFKHFFEAAIKNKINLWIVSPNTDEVASNLQDIANRHTGHAPITLTSSNDFDIIKAEQYRIAIFLVPTGGSSFIIDPEVAKSEIFPVSRQLRDITGKKIYWADRLGGVTDMEYFLDFN